MIEGLKPYTEYKESGLPWLGSVPAHWVTKRGKSYMTAIDRRSQAGKEELLTVSSARGVIPRNTAKVTMFKAESYAGYKLCWPGDLVINSLWAWGGGLGVAAHHGIISTAYSVYRPRPSAQMNPRFLHELVRSSSFNWELHVRSKGIWISRLQLTDTSFLDAPIPLPPPVEQAAIVRFLDHANRKIDGFIRAKRKLIGLLNEQKQAIIHRAVTRGLNAATAFKPSGIPWLSGIPAHWGIVRNMALFAHRVEPGVAGHPVLQVSLRSGITAEELDQFGRPKRLIADATKYKRIHQGDMAYNTMRMWQGAVGVSPCDGLVSPAYVVLKPRQDTCADFYDFIFHTEIYKQQVNRQSTGIVSDRNRLYWDSFKQMPNLTLPRKEQQEIVTFIAKETAALNTAIARTEREIALMQEYRTRLTADIVTGKLDVREAAAKLTDLPIDTAATEPAAEALDEASDLEDAEPEGI
jgi:type I restriction enzyme S subunit